MIIISFQETDAQIVLLILVFQGQEHSGLIMIPMEFKDSMLECPIVMNVQIRSLIQIKLLIFRNLIKDVIVLVF